MTITVRADKIGGTFSIGANGPKATRVFGVTTTAGESMDEILAHASIPAYGEAYPYSDSGYVPIYAVEIECAPAENTNNVYFVTVNYARPDQAQKEPGTTEDDCTIQVGSSVTSVETNKDKDGNQIILNLDGFPPQTGTINIQVPETMVIFERREAASPFAKSVANVGKINSVALGSGAFAEKTLLCVGIEGTTTDDGETWQVSYRFQYSARTWVAEVVYTDPETGMPAEGVVIATNTGYKQVDAYGEVDFTGLNLPW